MNPHDRITLPDHRRDHRSRTRRRAFTHRAQDGQNRPRPGREWKAQQGRRGSAAKTIRVLICDDSVHARTTLARAVGREEGVEVTAVAESFEEAVDKMRGAPVDVLLLDVFLPGKTGLEGLVALAEAGDDTPVVLMSADGNFETQGHSLGASAFFDKTTADFARLADLLRQAGQTRSGGP